MAARRRPPARKGSAATLADVARVAGVSTASASRALNTPALVSEELRARVAQAASTLGYAPHAAAQALAAARSRIVGIVVPTIAFSIFAPGIEAIERELEGHGYGLLIATSGYDPVRELEQIRRLVARGVDGIILVGLEHAREMPSFLASANVPYVCQGAYSASSPHPSVGFDNEKAIALAVDHLLELGHRRIAVLSGISAGNDRVQSRVQGIRKQLSLAGLKPIVLVEAAYGIQEGRRATALLLKQRPTAIVCINDVLAAAAIFEVQARGLALPDDISITGFDDIEFFANMTPSLTTVRVPVASMGQGAARTLLSAIARQPYPHATEIPVELVVRASTGPASRRSAVARAAGA